MGRYIAVFLPSIAIAAVLIILGEPLKEAPLVWGFVLLAGAIIPYGIFFNPAAKKITKAREEAYVLKLQDALATLEPLEIFSAGLAQPVRSIQLGMPLSPAPQNMDLGLFMAGQLSEAQKETARREFKKFYTHYVAPLGQNCMEHEGLAPSNILDEKLWDAYMIQWLLDSAETVSAALECSQICYIIFCGMDSQELDHEAGLKLLHHMAAWAAMQYNSWEQYGQAISYAVRHDPAYGLKERFFYAMQLRDLQNQRLASPWLRTVWAKGEIRSS